MMATQVDIFEIPEVTVVSEKPIEIVCEVTRRGYAKFDAESVRETVLGICRDDFVTGADIFQLTGMYPADVSLELFFMIEAGLLESKKNFFGSDHPSKPGYFGFHESYKVVSQC